MQHRCADLLGGRDEQVVDDREPVRAVRALCELAHRGLGGVEDGAGELGDAQRRERLREQVELGAAARAEEDLESDRRRQAQPAARSACAQRSRTAG